MSLQLGSRQDPPKFYAASGAGAVILLELVDCVRQAKDILQTGVNQTPASDGHPPVAGRIAAISRMDEHLPDELRAAAADMRACFGTIIHGIWEAVLPLLKTLHSEGFRPVPHAAGRADGCRPIQHI
ncbi:MAG TPA: hypothetical protein VGF62_08335 [Rhizomicrobium sp.]